MTRSNRTLTQFAADRLSDFIRNPSTLLSETKGNTTVSVKKNRLTQELTFEVLLFGISIFELSSQCLTLRNGGFFDSKGRPSRTTRERLNGLLDAAGALDLIPEGVRLFLGHNGQKDTCFVGKGATVALLDSQIHDRVIVRNHLQLLLF
tara:strand:+ start:1488 stop:1934 length:447 start_codon:yes stop_codon:yes gene_type:complete